MGGRVEKTKLVLLTEVVERGETMIQSSNKRGKSKSQQNVFEKKKRKSFSSGKGENHTSSQVVSFTRHHAWPAISWMIIRNVLDLQKKTRFTLSCRESEIKVEPLGHGLEMLSAVRYNSYLNCSV